MDVSFFGPRLKEMRKAAGLTQGELAGRAGLSKGGVANLEQGLREPAWSTVAALAEALGVDCRAFLEAPSVLPERHRGRPPKRPSGPEQARPKSPRGRSQKAPPDGTRNRRKARKREA